MLDLLSLQWTSTTLPGRMLEAAAVMAAKGHILMIHILLTKAWISDLTRAGYKFPDLGQHSGRLPAAPLGPLTPQIVMAAPLNGTFIFPRRWCLHQDKGLVVNINRLGIYNSAQQIKLLHAAYRPLFPQVLFTGTGTGTHPSPDMQEHIDQRRLHICDSYEVGILAEAGPGFMAYACAAGLLASDSWGVGLRAAIGMLYINDDVVFSPRMLSGLNSSNIWYSTTLKAMIAADARKAWWRWDVRHSNLNLTVYAAMQQVLQDSSGLMAKRKAAYLKDGAKIFPGHQADTFFLPARFQKEYIAMAQQMHALRVISEAAVPNMLGLLRTQPADIEPVSFAWAWQGERDCLNQHHTAVMPLHGNLSIKAVQRCVGDISAAEQSARDGLFALHPIKFSNTAVAQHWLDWWMSQSC